MLNAMTRLSPERYSNDLMTKLLTAVNKDGMTPFQARLHMFKRWQEREEEKERKQKRRGEMSRDQKTERQMEEEREMERKSEMDFQDGLKNFIIDCFSEVPDILKALYGTKGWF